MPLNSFPVEHLFTLTAQTSLASRITGGPAGTRLVVNVTGGTVAGPAIRGTVVGPSGDWVIARPDGSLSLDVRLLVRTDDGADILMTYRGIATDGGATIRTAPLFETGDARYSWLNWTQAVAIGKSGGGQVVYDVYQLV